VAPGHGELVEIGQESGAQAALAGLRGVLCVIVLHGVPFATREGRTHTASPPIV
jgi:hypothetical protein